MSAHPLWDLVYEVATVFAAAVVSTAILAIFYLIFPFDD